jgi:hypothetical protein
MYAGERKSYMAVELADGNYAAKNIIIVSYAID